MEWRSIGLVGRKPDYAKPRLRPAVWFSSNAELGAPKRSDGGRSGDGRICEPGVISGGIIRSRSIGSSALAESAYILVWLNRKT